ncbi:hypothetical protein Bca52824_032345 [Brassica carinata]|uniref:DUF220 domain-containing protein n=1 Tax=Brassica carinata TaxID=52824 RepID=A0A8X7SAX8_BRACI|nr:hypothetical protein Bca52824_032345 [Brassica carinata]
MGIFPGFGAWINLNNQQPPKAESKKSKNVKSKPGSEINTNAESEETKRQLKLWRAEEKKFPWLRDYPPKVKVSKSSIGETHLEMDFSIGLPPETVFDIVTSHDNQTYSYFKQMKRRKILTVKSSKVLRDNGRDEKVVVVKKSAPWKFLWWDGKMPIDLVLNENRKDLITLFRIPKEDVMNMERFMGQLQIKPWYIDSDKYCTARLPKNPEEYRKCSGGKGFLGSNLKLDLVYMPMQPLDMPPFSWYIRRVTIKNTKRLMEDFQLRGAVLRSI